MINQHMLQPPPLEWLQVLQIEIQTKIVARFWLVWFFVLFRFGLKLKHSYELQRNIFKSSNVYICLSRKTSASSFANIG